MNEFDFEFQSPDWRELENLELSLPSKPSDEELIKKIQTRMRRYVSEIACSGVELQQKELENLSDRVVRKSLRFCLYPSQEERDTDLESVCERLKDRVKEMAGRMMLIWQKEKSLFESNRNLAEAAISDLLDKAGYDYYIRYNHGHAKVHIKITRYKKAILYLKYDRLDRQLPKVLETLESMKRIYEIFGSGSGVVSLYDCDNDIFEDIRAEKEDREKGEEYDEGYDCFSY